MLRDFKTSKQAEEIMAMENYETYSLSQNLD